MKNKELKNSQLNEGLKTSYQEMREEMLKKKEDLINFT